MPWVPVTSWLSPLPSDIKFHIYCLSYKQVHNASVEAQCYVFLTDVPCTQSDRSCSQELYIPLHMCSNTFSTCSRCTLLHKCAESCLKSGALQVKHSNPNSNENWLLWKLGTNTPKSRTTLCSICRSLYYFLCDYSLGFPTQQNWLHTEEKRGKAHGRTAWRVSTIEPCQSHRERKKAKDEGLQVQAGREWRRVCKHTKQLTSDNHTNSSQDRGCVAWSSHTFSTQYEVLAGGKLMPTHHSICVTELSRHPILCVRWQTLRGLTQYYNSRGCCSQQFWCLYVERTMPALLPTQTLVFT